MRCAQPAPTPPFYDKSMRNFFPLIPKDDIFRLRPFRQSRKGIPTQKGKPGKACLLFMCLAAAHIFAGAALLL